MQLIGTLVSLSFDNIVFVIVDFRLKGNIIFLEQGYYLLSFLILLPDIRDRARFYYCLLTNVSSKKVRTL